MNALLKSLIPPIVFLLSFAGCGGKQQSTITPPSQGKTLSYWRLKSDPDPVYDQIISLGIKDITVKYHVFEDEKEYETTLLKALSEGKGPDIFSIANDQLEKYRGKLAPAPSSLLNTSILEPILPTQFAVELLSEHKLYGVPFEIEPLMLITNKSLFPEELLDVEIPLSWKGVRELAVKLTVIKNGKMQISGLALGTGKEIQRSAQILQLLMMQNNTQMITPDRSQAAFHLFRTKENGEVEYPGVWALKYYTDFANPKSDHYTYDPALGDDVKAFSENKVAMMINYPSVLNFLSKVMPNVDKVKIYPVPNLWEIDFPTKEEAGKISQPKDMTRYHIEVVNKNSPNAKFAWEFLLEVFKQSGGFGAIAKNPTEQEDYLERKPIRFSTSFYKGAYPEETDKIFVEMADDVIRNNLPPQEAILKAADKFNLLLKKTEELNQTRETNR
jgi:ABC-type glycerol-3-phosphate transport system substrate-binding protein